MRWPRSVALLALVACAPVTVTTERANRWVPMVLRPDTRDLVDVAIDSANFNDFVRIYNAAYPNEVAVCFAGHVEEREVYPGDSALVVVIERVMRAVYDSADLYDVWFPAEPWSGCEDVGDLVGIGHTHPQEPLFVACDQSDPDSRLLFRDTRALFAMVLCAGNRGQVFWQDGRRNGFRW